MNSHNLNLLMIKEHIILKFIKWDINLLIFEDSYRTVNISSISWIKLSQLLFLNSLLLKQSTYKLTAEQRYSVSTLRINQWKFNSLQNLCRRLRMNLQYMLSYELNQQILLNSLYIFRVQMWHLLYLRNMIAIQICSLKRMQIFSQHTKSVIMQLIWMRRSSYIICYIIFLTLS